MMIPTLIVPTLNRPDLLVKMLASVDVEVSQTIVIDNGGKVPPEIEAIRLPHNIGVAASWNLGIQCSPRALWWLITNDDLEFGPGDLQRLCDTVEPSAACLYLMLGMAAFVVTRYTLNAVGMFDESITPAYNEDVDFQRRCELAGVPRVEVGFSGTHVGSATIMADPILRSINGVTHTANDAYYTRKWGGHKLGGETYSTPFNRGGHLGDWRLDPERLRSQAWPRRP